MTELLKDLLARRSFAGGGWNDIDDDESMLVVEPAAFSIKCLDAREVELVSTTAIKQCTWTFERLRLTKRPESIIFVDSWKAEHSGAELPASHVLGAVSSLDLRHYLEHTATHAGPATGRQVHRPASVALAPAMEDLRAAAFPAEDGGDDPPSGVAVATAAELIVTAYERWSAHLGEKALPLHIAPTPTGGIHVEWEGPSNALQVNVGSRGALNLLFIRGPRTNRDFDERHRVSLATVGEMIDRALGG